jgi:hypothetical protein
VCSPTGAFAAFYRETGLQVDRKTARDGKGVVMKYYFLALGTLVVVCVGCAGLGDGQQLVDNKQQHHAPPAHMLQHPGPMVGGPGPGVMSLPMPPMMPPGPARGRVFETQKTQIRFIGQKGMTVGWLIPGGWAENQVFSPGRYNFSQGATYRLKLSKIPGREDLTLYPTLQVYPSDPTTDHYVAHNTVPLELNDDDIEQVESNNFVTKVIYLPDPKFQDQAIAGLDTLVSTRLDPGVDPVAEADRRGSIMAVLRMGNMDLEMPQAMGGQGGDQPKPAKPEGNEGVFIPGQINPVGYFQSVRADGAAGQHAPPMPIAGMSSGMPGIPGAVIVADRGYPGMPTMSPISGMNMPQYGMPMTSTPIGLPGPPHIPLGGRASLKSHTVRNKTKYNIPKPVEHFLIDVEHKPGISLPKPVSHIEYTETHPTFRPGELSYPAHTLPQPGTRRRR